MGIITEGNYWMGEEFSPTIQYKKIWPRLQHIICTTSTSFCYNFHVEATCIFLFLSKWTTVTHNFPTHTVHWIHISSKINNLTQAGTYWLCANLISYNFHVEATCVFLFLWKWTRITQITLFSPTSTLGEGDSYKKLMGWSSEILKTIRRSCIRLAWV